MGHMITSARGTCGSTVEVDYYEYRLRDIGTNN